MSTGRRLVEADWTLLHTCNFRCDYCFVPVPLLSEKIRVSATNEQWAAAFDQHDVTWQIHMTGGEPSAYPGFVDLCARLTQNNFISLNSNLTNKSLLEFADRIDPDGVIFINAGLHHKERSNRSLVPAFIERARHLSSRGFNVMVTAVMSAEFLEVANDVRRELAHSGIVLVPKILRGSFDGKQWPHAYTAGQRSEILALLDLSEPELQKVSDRGGQQLSIDVRHDRQLLGEGQGLMFKVRDIVSQTAAMDNMFRGKPCGAGLSFVSITPSGDVYRCSSKRPLGNLLNGSFAFMNKAERCDTTYCPYFCFKHTSPVVINALSQKQEFLPAMRA